MLKSFFLRSDGTIFVQVLIYSILLLGTAGLAIDFGRVYSVNTQMQALADHIALAVAAELDGSSDAIERGNRVVDGFTGNAGPLLEKQTPFTAVGDDILVRPPVYLTGLPNDPNPDDPNYPIADVAGLTTTDGKLATHVLIQVVPDTVQFALLPFLSLLNPAVAVQTETNAVAIATLEQEICNVPPLMICNPWEGVAGGFPDNSTIRGTQIRAKTQGPGAPMAPGNFGFLQTADSAGDPYCTGAAGSAARLRCVFALNAPNSVCVGGRVDTKSGEAVAVHKGINTRFDMWSSPMNSYKNDPLVSPAPNVIKGKYPESASQCGDNKQTITPDVVALPRDSCFATETCVPTDIGNKVTVAQLQSYWTTNHDYAGSPQLTLPVGIATRYDTYLAEIAEGRAFLDNLSATPAALEQGSPLCYTGNTYENLNIRRRSIILAVIDCVAHDVKGAATNIPVVKYLDTFLTEPATDPGGGNSGDGATLWLEVVGVVEPGDETGTLHEFPVLVR